ncbi:hypothetical protein ACAW74_24825 [Fibrella sp. WM1]|uniref:alginate O-acetyltransferase AlgX-related protein n=1 Tax=Fibrella musci TaxID=3242485 RepID=UPI0035230EA5
MKKLYTRSLVGFFFVLLLLPTVEYFLGLTTVQTMENKQMIQAKGQGVDYLKSIVKQINSYYVGNFGGRNLLVYCHSFLNYFLLKQSPIPEQVVLGKDGWLFAGDQSSNVMKQHIGLYPLSLDSARVIADHLVATQKRLNQRGIKLYVLIAPDSHSIYPEKLPDIRRPNQLYTSGSDRPETPHDVLTMVMKQYPEISYVDLRDTLLHAKTIAPVYQQTDTHWNNLGALIGYASLMKRMRSDFPTLPPILKEEYRYKKMAGEGGDLAGLMMLRKQIPEPYLYWIEPKKSLKAVEKKGMSKSALGYPDTQWVGPDASLPSLLVFGDSFSPSLMLFLPAHFRTSCLVRQSTLDWKRIDAQKPDAVVVEIVERNLRALSRL